MYSITDSDQFTTKDYLAVINEVAIIVKQTKDMLSAYKEDIIISYLKDHAINNTWIIANPLLTMLITSNVLPTVHIEALFDASRPNSVFRKQFEAYVKEILPSV